jgi:hypothetical protein
MQLSLQDRELQGLQAVEYLARGCHLWVLVRVRVRVQVRVQVREQVQVRLQVQVPPAVLVRVRLAVLVQVQVRVQVRVPPAVLAAARPAGACRCWWGPVALWEACNGAAAAPHIVAGQSAAVLCVSFWVIHKDATDRRGRKEVCVKVIHPVAGGACCPPCQSSS